MHPQIRLLRTYPQRDLIVDRGHAPQPMYRDNGSIHIAHLQEEKPSDISHASHSQGASSFHLCEAKAEIAKTSNQRTRLTGLSVGGYITCPGRAGRVVTVGGWTLPKELPTIKNQREFLCKERPLTLVCPFAKGKGGTRAVDPVSGSSSKCVLCCWFH